MTTLDALSQQAGRRSRGYWLLSRLFLEVPTAPVLRDLQQALGADSDEPPALAALREAVAAALAVPEDAAVAFTRHLSLGDKKAGEALPYEAHVREGQLPGESTRQVVLMMQAAGFGDVAPGAPSPDHLGAELRFMALLCHQEHQAWLAGERAAAAECLRLQRKFLTEHLASWAPDYCRGLAERTTNAYLLAVARLTGQTVGDDVAVLDDICRWIVPEDLASAAPSAGRLH